MFASLACQEVASCPPRSRTSFRAFGVAAMAALALLATSSAAEAKTEVLLVPGGAWTSANPAMMNPLHDQLRTHRIASKSVSYFEGSSFIPAQLARVRRSVRAAKRRGNRVILYGISAGGQLSLALAAKGEVDGAVAIAPPTDLLTLSALIPANYGMTDLQAYQMSPLRRLTKRAAPTLLLHGDADTLVPLEQSQRYLAAARHYQRDVSLVTMPGQGHAQPPWIYQERAARWIKHRMR